MKRLLIASGLGIAAYCLGQFGMPSQGDSLLQERLRVGGDRSAFLVLIVRPEISQILVDGPYVYVAYGRTVAKLRKEDFEVVRERALDSNAGKPQEPSGPVLSEFSVENVDIREALRKLFRQVNHSYSISPSVQGTVSMDVRGVPFDRVLSSLLALVDSTYRLEAGVYQCITRAEATLVEPPRIRSMAMDEKNLYVAAGSEIFRLLKSDLSIAVRKQVGLANAGHPRQGATGDDSEELKLGL